MKVCAPTPLPPPPSSSNLLPASSPLPAAGGDKSQDPCAAAAAKQTFTDQHHYNLLLGKHDQYHPTATTPDTTNGDRSSSSSTLPASTMTNTPAAAAAGKKTMTTAQTSSSTGPSSLIGVAAAAGGSTTNVATPHMHKPKHKRRMLLLLLHHLKAAVLAGKFEHALHICSNSSSASDGDGDDHDAPAARTKLIAAAVTQADTSALATHTHAMLNNQQQQQQRQHRQSTEEEDPSTITILLIAIACLQRFVVLNWIHDATNKKGAAAADSDHHVQQQQHGSADAAAVAIRSLSLDGEDFYPHAKRPELLLAARVLLMQLTAAHIPSNAAGTDDQNTNSTSHGKRSKKYNPWIQWWTLRCCTKHQDMLFNPSQTLAQQIETSVHHVKTHFAQRPNTPIQARLAASIECAMAHMTLSQYGYARTQLKHAENSVMRIDIKLGGALGKRTKFQTVEKALPTICISPIRNDGTTNDAQCTSMQSGDMAAVEQKKEAIVSSCDVCDLPVIVPVESDVLLAEPIFAKSATPQGESASDSPLTLEEQLIVAAKMQLERISRPVNDEIARIEVDAYASRILSPLFSAAAAAAAAACPEEEEEKEGKEVSKSALPSSKSGMKGKTIAYDTVYSAAFYALLIKSRVSTKDTHVQGHALLQFEALAAEWNSTDLCDERDIARRRLKFLHAVPLPPAWQVSRTFADYLLSQSMHKSALDIYVRLMVWDRAIDCFITLGRCSEAEQLIRGTIKEHENRGNADLARRAAPSLPSSPAVLLPLPLLYCYLGDLLGNTEWYHKAWDVSQQKYPRAMRSLGMVEMREGKFVEAIEHLEKALEINTVFRTHWFALGFCALQIQDWRKAVKGFTEVVRIDPEYGDAWNNLAAAHLNLKSYVHALNALEQAVKFKRDSWKLFENLFLTAMRLGELQRACAAYEQVVELRLKAIKVGGKGSRSVTANANSKRLAGTGRICDDNAPDKEGEKYEAKDSTVQNDSEPLTINDAVDMQLINAMLQSARTSIKDAKNDPDGVDVDVSDNNKGGAAVTTQAIDAGTRIAFALERMMQMFFFIVQRVTMHVRVWDAFAQLCMLQKEWITFSFRGSKSDDALRKIDSQLVTCRERQCQSAEWSEGTPTELLLSSAIELGRVSLGDGSGSANLSASKLKLESILAKVEKRVGVSTENAPGTDVMRETIDLLHNLVEELAVHVAGHATAVDTMAVSTREMYEENDMMSLYR